MGRRWFKISKKSKIAPNNVEKRLVTKKSINKEKRKKLYSKLLNIVIGLLYPIALFFVSCIIERDSLQTTFRFLGKNMGIMARNIIIMYLIFYILLCIINRTWICITLASIIYLILPVISKVKFNIRGEPLFLNELALINTPGELAGFTEISNELQTIVLFTLIFIVMFSVIILLKKIKTKRRNSLIMLCTMIITIIVLFFIPGMSSNLLRTFGVELGVRYSPNIIHEKYGTYLGIYSNYVLNTPTEPVGYSKEKVFEIIEDFNKIDIASVISGDNTLELIKVNEDTIKPNIVMIMSESFFDPKNIENVTYSEDPISNIRKYIEENTSGTFVSSTFGGGTSNVEFEAFTGNTMEFLPYGIVPYIDLENYLENCETIQKNLKKQKYKTIAIHSYDKSFYNRQSAYEKLGFDEFYDYNTMDNIYYYGKYISDSCLVDNIISKLEDGDEPKFIWALSMQNHTPYSMSNYGEEGLIIDVQSDRLSKNSEDKLTAFVNGLYETDRSMKKLIDYLDKSKTPTVVIFYGDHLPGFNEVYLDSGNVKTKDSSKWTTKEMIKMHMTPFFIYDNYKSKEAVHNEIVGAFSIGNYLLKYAGIPRTNYFQFIDSLDYVALRDRLFIDKEGNIFDKISDECIEQANQHKMLEYDIIYGKKYVSEYGQ